MASAIQIYLHLTGAPAPRPPPGCPLPPPLQLQGQWSDGSANMPAQEAGRSTAAAACRTAAALKQQQAGPSNATRGQEQQLSHTQGAFEGLKGRAARG
jgi:hypothetical protein